MSNSVTPKCVDPIPVASTLPTFKLTDSPIPVSVVDPTLSLETPITERFS